MMHVVAKQAAGPYEADGTLMERVAQGDSQAQRLLALRLAPRVQRLAQRLLAGHPDADDAAQNALIEILRSAPSYAQRASVERWADRIAARTILRHAREQRRPWSLWSSTQTDELPAPSRTDVSWSEEAPQQLATYLAQLPPRRREVLVLKHGLDYTTEEIAELLGAPVGTVKDRLVAARRSLRKLIQRDAVTGARRNGN